MTSIPMIDLLTIIFVLVDQSQFNRRARALRLLVEQMRRVWLVKKGWHLHTCYLLDTKPVPALGYKCDKRHSEFAGQADYGVGASRILKYLATNWSRLAIFQIRRNLVYQDRFCILWVLTHPLLWDNSGTGFSFAFNST